MAFKLALNDEIVAVDSATFILTLVGGPNPPGHISKGVPVRLFSFLRPEEQAFPFLIYNVYFAEI